MLLRAPIRSGSAKRKECAEDEDEAAETIAEDECGVDNAAEQEDDEVGKFDAEADDKAGQIDQKSLKSAMKRKIKTARSRY